MKKNCPNNNSGFTLIELLVVIAIISIMAAALFMVINPARIQADARNAIRASDLRQLASALERYIAKNGTYPTTPGIWCSAYNTWGDCGSEFIPGLVSSGEIDKLPKDPKDSQPSPYGVGCGPTTYIYLSNGTDYKLLAHCTPENISSSDPLLDPARPTYSWGIWTQGAVGW